jgi:hypothetical protein
MRSGHSIRLSRSFSISLAALLLASAAGLLQAQSTGPSGIPQKAAQNLGKAQQWHSDAQLMMIDINDFSNNGNFTTMMYFRSPSTGGGFMVGDAGALETPAANWGNNPITGQFIDLPAAVTTARAHGMVGAFNHAMLQGTASGPVWTITPTQPTSTAHDPFIRNGAFQIPAAVK